MGSPTLIIFWLIASVLIILGWVLLLFAPHLPQSLQDLFLYGKVRGKRSTWTIVRWIEVPKRWFLYFYVVGTLINGLMVFLSYKIYFSDYTPPECLETLLEGVNYGSQKTQSCDQLSAVLLIGLMFLQNVRRLQESLLVSVYSKSTMNLLHFILGVVLYSTFPLAVLCEAPPLSNKVTEDQTGLVRWNHMLGTVLFVWASWHHNKVHHQLASLRLNKSGDSVASYDHKLPMGGWFDLVSCPHFTMEILIYVAFFFIAGPSHLTVASVVLFVLSNQLVAGDMTHRWYKDKFKETLPKSRKAVIPYLY